MRKWTDKETGIKFCEPDCADEWLGDLWAIGCDYDGRNTVEDLKKLVDELLEMAHRARVCLWNNKLFGEYGMPENIGDEELASNGSRDPQNGEWV